MIFSAILYVLKVRDTTKETKKKMNKKMNEKMNNAPNGAPIANWTSYNQQRRDLNRLADIQRLQKHNSVLEFVLAGLIGASVALAGVIIHMMVSGPKWTW